MYLILVILRKNWIKINSNLYKRGKYMEEKKKNKKTIILIVIIIIETVILAISMLYSSALFFMKNAETEWFNEISPDGRYHVKCMKVGSPLFFSSQELLVYFDTTTNHEKQTNSSTFKTELENDGATLYNNNYSIEWLEDSVRIVFRGKETGGDKTIIIPYIKEL